MVQIPTFTNPNAVPVVRMPLMDPGAASQVGAAIARAGGSVSEEMSAFEQKYSSARRQADATNIVSGVSAKLGELEFNYSKIPDRNQAMTGFKTDAEKLRAETLAGIKDPEVSSYVQRQFDQEAQSRSQSTGNSAFRLESSKRRGDLDTNLSNFAQSAATATTAPLREQMLQNGTTAIEGAVSAGWLDPEAGARRILTFKSQVQEVAIAQGLTAAAQTDDPDKADSLFAAINDPANFPGLTPDKREILAARADGLAARLASRQASRQAHEDAQADKQMRQRQAQNETGYLADIYSGKPVDMAQVYAKGYAGELSAAGINAIESAVDRRTAGRDDPQAMAHLWGAIGDGTAGRDDVYAAGASGRIRGETMSEMVRALNEREKEGNSAVERGAFNTLKTALSGAAIEQGIADKIFGSGAAKATQAWGQAQGEWNRRVILNKEDPMAALSDLAPKYSDTVQRPTWLPTPKFGSVSDRAGLDAVALRTLQARDRGEIDPATYQGEVQILNNYRAFYSEKAIREAASIAIPFAKPGGKAKTEKAAP